MAFPESNGEDAQLQYENFSDWACARCFKNISAARPPIFNADNCSCVEVASYQYAEPTAYQQPPYHYEDTTLRYHNQPPSYASSSASVPCPEGPEHEMLSLQVDNSANNNNDNSSSGYLPLVAEPGLNETEHRRRASFTSDMSFPMQRFLCDREAHQHYGTEHADRASSTTTFLSQELHVQPSKKVQRGSPRSKLSWVSESSRSGEASVISWGMADPLSGAGGWDRRSGQFACAGEVYPMVMSGMTDGAGFDGE